ncbi:MAG TPA: glycoside hydrolase family 1 protein [Solirubrobacteraceae bacterium]|nr:glycoside hydrolase family 1 protein [Solirubrobacteraceae bacterium]
MRCLVAFLTLAALAITAVTAGPAGAAAGDAAGRPFPQGFAWGVATSGFQTEAGGRPSNADRGSDWWAWTHDAQNIAAGRVTADSVEDGPGDWRPAVFRRDVALARGLHARAFRLGIEWSRVFPRSTAAVRLSTRPTRAQLRRLDRLADHGALRRYAAMLRAVRRAGLEPFVTVDHFTLPAWLHDAPATRDALAGRDPDAGLPAFTRPAGWLDASSVAEFRKYAAYLAWRLGRLVTYWTPLNEPLVVAASGFVNVPGVLAENFPPGAFSYTAAITAMLRQVRANAAAYDVIHRLDRRARVGLVHNMVAFTPADPSSAADRRAAGHATYLFDRWWLNAAVNGAIDRDGDGAVAPAERDARARGKADFIGVNYYFRGRVTALAAPLSARIPVLDFLPATKYASVAAPEAPPCPTTCSDLGSEIYPEGLTEVLRIAGSYGLPLYVTENGIADADDDQRPAYLVRQLAVLRRAIAGGARVRGWFHWSLTDNFEWASGYAPRFGLYAYDPATLRRTARPSAALVRRIFGAGRLAGSELRRYGA